MPTGATYVLSVSAKQYTFAEPTRIVNLSEDVADADFVGSEP